VKKAKIKTVVCCTNTKRAKVIDKMKPSYIAVEPRELIGGKISVAQARPGLISKTVQEVKTPVLVGAGIHNSKDVKKALELGANGLEFDLCITKDQKIIDYPYVEAVW